MNFLNRMYVRVKSHCAPQFPVGDPIQQSLLRTSDALGRLGHCHVLVGLKLMCPPHRTYQAPTVVPARKDTRRDRNSRRRKRPYRCQWAESPDRHASREQTAPVRAALDRPNWLLIDQTG
jgi:hypothetical protein